MTVTYAPAFQVLYGSATLNAGVSNITLTEGVDYTLPDGVDGTSCFMMLSNTRRTGDGPPSGGGINPHMANYGVYLDNPENIATSVTVRRTSTTGATRFQWQIICYIGPAGGPNEMIVRSHQHLSGTGPTLFGATVTADFAKCATFVTSQQNGSTTTGAWWESLYRAGKLNPGGGEVQSFAEKAGAGTLSNVSFALVEFSGSNWGAIATQEFLGANSTIWAPGDSLSFTETLSTPVKATARTILSTQYRTNNVPCGLDDAGDAVELSATNQVRIYQRTDAGLRGKTIWTIEHDHDNAEAGMIVEHLAWADDTVGVSDSRFFSQSHAAVRSTTEVWYLFSVSIDGSGNIYPRGSISFGPQNTTTVELFEADDGQERRFAGCVVQLPRDEIIDPELLQSATVAPTIDQQAPGGDQTVPVGGADSFPVVPVGAFQPITNLAEGGETGSFVVGDNHGDSHMIIANGHYYWAMRLYDPPDPPPQPGRFFMKPYDGDLYNNWPAFDRNNVPGAFPITGITQSSNTDTFCLVWDEVTSTLICYYSAFPGSIGETEVGRKSSIQRRISTNPTVDDTGWQQFANDHDLVVTDDWEVRTFTEQQQTIFEEGVQEQSVVPPLVPGGEFLMFFGGKDNPTAPASTFPYNYERDPFGESFNFRMGRARAPAAGIDLNPQWTKDPAGAGEGTFSTNWVFDPIAHGAGGAYGGTNETAIWGTGRSPQQWNVSRDPTTGRLHLVALGSKPNTGQGIQNASTGIGHWWSDDEGLTWTADPNNPLATWDTFEAVNFNEANKINSPFLVWDTIQSPARVYLVCTYNDDGVNKDGTRFMAYDFEFESTNVETAVTDALAPTIVLLDQIVTVGVETATTSTVEPSEVAQTVPSPRFIDGIPRAVAISLNPAVAVSIGTPVPSVAVGTATFSPSVDRAVDVREQRAVPSTLAPETGSDQFVAAPTEAAAGSSVAPAIDQQVLVGFEAASTLTLAPSVELGTDVNVPVPFEAAAGSTVAPMPTPEQFVAVGFETAVSAEVAPLVSTEGDILVIVKEIPAAVSSTADLLQEGPPLGSYQWGCYALMSYKMRITVGDVVENLDEIVAGLLGANIGGGKVAVSTAPELEVGYPNAYVETPNDLTWADISIRHTFTEKSAWGDHYGEGHRYRLNGEVRVILRSPLQQGDGLLLVMARELMQVVLPGRLDEVIYGLPVIENEGQEYGGGRPQGWRVDVVWPTNWDCHIPSLPDLIYTLGLQGGGGLLTQNGEQILLNSRGSRLNAQSAARQRFGREIEDRWGLIAIYDNDPTRPPNDKLWVRFTVTTAGSEEGDIGVHGQAHVEGEAIAHIMEPLGVGTFDSLALADDIVLRFVSVSESFVRFTTPSVETVGRNGQWWQTNVRLPFSYEEVT